MIRTIPIDDIRQFDRQVLIMKEWPYMRFRGQYSERNTKGDKEIAEFMNTLDGEKVRVLWRNY